MNHILPVTLDSNREIEFTAHQLPTRFPIGSVVAGHGGGVEGNDEEAFARRASMLYLNWSAGR
jgi:hypothetical protein